MADRKRIVVCCDGTWNSPDETSQGVPCPTNVVRMAEAVKSSDKGGVEQKLFYDPGIGSSGGWLQRCFEGATGTGMSKNILDAYRYLIHNYTPGDELYFFGFSRGAFTARSLAGLIRNSGLLRPDAVDNIDKAYKLYRSRRKGAHPKEKEATLFRKTYAVEDITPIKFIGVWDTVGALGNPVWLSSPLSMLNSFHDVSLSSTIENAYQAMAVDEKRKNFKECLWVQPQPAPKKQTLEQVWFAGVHSDIGGGYPDVGLSDIALKWMVDKAKSCGLEFSPFRPGPKPDYKAPCHESWKGLYKIIPVFHRKVMKGINTNESIHSSVKKKYEDDSSYKPVNLKDILGPKP
ncbi:DUF2235 domain-containing protein [uncultured Pseudodesulfovibrio sp.]|uniref:DUF2235 domain-containing protein n=1 Tax=uncultured Pseudodesulfovibrio sp. TaxID=2035858 RepID=UPI0029C6FA3C|nr:DUF2235 domain-containing protein [uncultured Pseudodesulfovibrio sp.]